MRSSARRDRRAIRVLAWCGVVAPVIRLTLILVLGSLDPDYSQLRDAISELGARGAPYAGLMNYLGIGLVGVLLALFSIALHRALRPGRLVTLGAGLLALSGFAFVVVGLAPCDPGCSRVDPSVTMRIHLVAGLTAMMTQTLAAVVFGARALDRDVVGPHPLISGLLGLVAAAALVVFLLQVGGAGIRHPGLAQKIAQAATDLWVLSSAVLILGDPARGEGRAS